MVFTSHWSNNAGAAIESKPYRSFPFGWGPTPIPAIPHHTGNCDSRVSAPIVPELHVYLCGAKGLCNQSMRCLNFSPPTHGLSDVRISVRCQQTGRRISKGEPFRTRLSKTRRHRPFQVQADYVSRRSPRRLVHSEVVLTTGLWLAFDCRHRGNKLSCF